jgi:hypothetical protein
MDHSELDLLLANVSQWRAFRSSCPDAYRLILEASNRDFDVPAEEIPPDVVQAAGSHGIELEDSASVEALSERSAAHAWLLSYVEGHLAPASDEPALFCDAIWRLTETDVLPRLEAYRFCLAALDVIYGKSLLAILPKLHGDHSCVWEVLPVFWELLPGLDADAELLIQHLPRIHDIVGEDLTADVFQSSIREFSEFHPEIAELACLGLLKKGDQSAVTIATYLMVGAAKARPGHMCKLALHLSAAESGQTASAAIVALSNLDYSAPELDGRLAQVIERLEILERNESLVGAVSLAYCNLARQGHDLGDKLVQLSQHTNPISRHHVSSLLLGRPQKEDDECWPTICLMNLARTTDFSHTRTLKRLDGTLAKLTKLDTPAVNRFLTQWVLDHSEGLAQHPIHATFQVTFLKLLEQRDMLEFLATAWLNTDLRPLHRAATQMLREASLIHSIHGDSPLVFSAQVLSRTSGINRVFILRKVLGWTYDIDNTSLFSLAFSVLHGVGSDPVLEGHVAAAFGNVLGYDYPDSCEQFLKDAAESEPGITQRVATAALRKIEEYRQERMGRPYLKELAPPSDRLARYDREIAKAMARSYKQAREKKPGLLQLASRQMLKFKCPYVFRDPDGKLRRGELHKYSETMEIPRGDSIAPIGHAVMLAKFRAETKAEVRSELEEREE